MCLVNFREKNIETKRVKIKTKKGGFSYLQLFELVDNAAGQTSIPSSI